ncbi:hypothetical protein QQP08_016201 [Theobroma cacao]|nr:hypothetical protein QQP08_016201 [Theobroma cacao]
MRKPPSNTVISSFTRTAAVAVVYVTVLAWFCAEATAHETYQQHETPSRCQSLCPIQRGERKYSGAHGRKPEKKPM